MPKTKTSRSRTTRGRSQRQTTTTRAINTDATPNTQNDPIAVPGDTSTEYDTLSTEVLHLLLAQRNLSLTGCRLVLLQRLKNYRDDVAQTSLRSEPTQSTVPASTTAQSSTITPPISRETLRSLASELAPILKEALAKDNTGNCSTPFVPSAAIDRTQPLDLGNPSHVASLLNPSTIPDLLPSTHFEVPNVPKKLEEQILTGEYVDFSSLLPGNSDRPIFGPVRISVEGDQGSYAIPIPSFFPPGKRPKIDSVDKWLTAFGIYASLVVSKFPHRASQFFAYQRIIREASQKFKGLAWYDYDMEFRRLAARNPSLNWGERHLQLWLDKFTGIARSLCFVCGGADHISDTCPLSPSRIQGNQAKGNGRQRAFCQNFNGVSRVPQHLAHSSTDATDSPVANTMEPLPTISPLTELMTLRVAENTSKAFLTSLKPFTPINTDLLESMLSDFPDPQFVHRLCSGLRDGFKIGYAGPRRPFFSNNLKTAHLMPEVVDANMLEEVKHGHTIGPFTSPRFQTCKFIL